jgi:hypothetical protein
VGIAVDTTVISIAAIERLSRSEMTVRGRLVLIARVDAPAGPKTQPKSVVDPSHLGVHVRSSNWMRSPTMTVIVDGAASPIPRKAGRT